jgi:hypothetical protein
MVETVEPQLPPLRDDCEAEPSRSATNASPGQVAYSGLLETRMRVRMLLQEVDGMAPNVLKTVIKA